MLGLIVTRQRANAVYDAVKGTGMDIWFEKVGTFPSEVFVHHCQAAAGVNLQTLIVDADSTDPASLVKGLRLFRSMRNTRIILIAPGRKPGDATITTLLPLQVWDIIAPDIETADNDDEESSSNNDQLSELIRRQLETEHSYGNAARWDVHAEQFIMAAAERQGKEVRKPAHTLDKDILEHIESLAIEPPPAREKVMLLETIIGTVLVAIIGVEENAGTTHTALLITNYLARKGKKVAIVEANDKKDFATIEYVYEGMRGFQSDKPSFSIKGVDYYKSGWDLDLAKLKEKNYEYIVLDLGCYEKSEYIEEFLRAHVQVVVGHGSDWRQQKIAEFSEKFKDRDQSNWIFCTPFADELSVDDIKKMIKSDRVYSIPAHPDPWIANRETDQVLDLFMKEYLGQRRAKNRTGLLYGIIAAAFVVIVILVILLLTRN